MPGYQVETHTHRIGAFDYEIRALADRMQFADPDGSAQRAGISSASWPIFGLLWPAGVALARAMSVIPLAGRRILETGCGLGLSSLVLRRRGADITASDHHPLAEAFLRHNSKLNGLSPIPFHRAQWGASNPELGRFDLIIGADLLYERDHPKLLAGFLALHAERTVQVVLADPGRGNCARFSALMRTQGYARKEERVMIGNGWPPGVCGTMLTYDRVAAG